MLETLSGVLVAAFGAAGVWLTARAKRQGDQDTTSLGWVDRMNARLTAQDEKIAAQDSKIDGLSREVEDLKMTNFDLRMRVSSMVAHVKSWRQAFADMPERWPVVPSEVSEAMDRSDR